MTPTPRRTRANRQSLRVWSFDQATSAVPYLTSIVRSLREHVLATQALRRRITRLDNQPGRADRRLLIDLQDARRDLIRVEEEYAASLAELTALDIQPLDLIRGQVLVPFIHDDQLAWYIFDLFDREPICSWRYQTDPEETRRQLTAAQMV